MWFLEGKAEDTFHFISLNCYIWLHVLISYLTLYFIDSEMFSSCLNSPEIEVFLTSEGMSQFNWQHFFFLACGT